MRNTVRHLSLLCLAALAPLFSSCNTEGDACSDLRGTWILEKIEICSSGTAYSGSGLGATALKFGEYAYNKDKGRTEQLVTMRIVADDQLYEAFGVTKDASDYRDRKAMLDGRINVFNSTTFRCSDMGNSTMYLWFAALDYETGEKITMSDVALTENRLSFKVSFSNADRRLTFKR